MPPAILRIAIDNATTGGDYTALLHVGAAATPVKLLLDTGSSMLAVCRATYDPNGDGSKKTTRLLQVANYLSGAFVGGVIQTSLSFVQNDGPAIALQGVNIAVTYDARHDMFANADGILGLAYRKLDNAWLMPADTWLNQYESSQVTLGSVCDIEPCFDQLADAGVAANVFAFSINRALRSALPNDAANAGIFVAGGGADCTDLYTPPLRAIAIMDAQYFNTNLLSVQIDGTAAIPVPQIAPGGSAISNSIIDSGSSGLSLDQDLYNAIVAAMNQAKPGLGAILQNAAIGAGSVDQTTLALNDWPSITLSFQGSDGNPVPWVLAPRQYWQFDAAGQGQAVGALCGDNGMLGGQSILGLPLFCGNFVIFDRTASSGNGSIRVAPQA